MGILYTFVLRAEKPYHIAKKGMNIPKQLITKKTRRKNTNL